MIRMAFIMTLILFLIFACSSRAVDEDGQVLIKALREQDFQELKSEYFYPQDIQNNDVDLLTPGNVNFVILRTLHSYHDSIFFQIKKEAMRITGDFNFELPTVFFLEDSVSVSFYNSANSPSYEKEIWQGVDVFGNSARRKYMKVPRTAILYVENYLDSICMENTPDAFSRKILKDFTGADDCSLIELFKWRYSALYKIKKEDGPSINATLEFDCIEYHFISTNWNSINVTQEKVCED